MTHSFMPILAAFSSGNERRENGSVGNRLLTSLKNARDDFTCTYRIKHTEKILLKFCRTENILFKFGIREKILLKCGITIVLH